jgi:hypothetical protein
MTTIERKRGVRVIEKALKQLGALFLLKPKSFGMTKANSEL